MKVNKYVMPILVIVAMFATVLVAQAAGIWQVSGSTQIVPNPTTGRPNPDEIKGKMTLDEIITQYGIPKDDLYTALRLSPDTPSSKQAKELESVIPNFSMDLVRQAVKDYYAVHP